MVTVYGTDWCEDTRRSLRHLRRLGVAHRYLNIDEDAEALARAKALNEGSRRTPTIDLGVGGAALIEPENDTLGGALVELEMLTQEEVVERLAHPERRRRRAGDESGRSGWRSCSPVTPCRDRCDGRCGWSVRRPRSQACRAGAPVITRHT